MPADSVPCAYRNRHATREPNVTDDEIDTAWSRSMASLAVDALMRAEVISKNEIERALAIVAEEIYVRLALRDRPDRENWRYAKSLGQ